MKEGVVENSEGWETEVVMLCRFRLGVFLPGRGNYLTSLLMDSGEEHHGLASRKQGLQQATINVLRFPSTVFEL